MEQLYRLNLQSAAVQRLQLPGVQRKEPFEVVMAKRKPRSYSLFGYWDFRLYLPLRALVTFARVEQIWCAR